MSKDDKNHGITWSTEYNLKISAAAENTLILGDSSEVVGGGSATFEVGGSAETMLLELLEVTLGFRQVLSNECKFNFSTEENEVKELEEKVDAHLTEIAAGIKVSALESKLKAVTSKVQTAGEETKALASQYDAVADKVGLYATKQDVNGTKEQIVAEATSALAESSRAIGNRVKTVAQRTESVAAKTATLGSQVKTVLQQTKNIAAATKMVGEETEISAIINKL